MQISVLGACRVRDANGAELDLGARKPRSVLAALALTPGRAVAADLLADLVWAGSPPRGAHGSLHVYISGLRRVLEPDRPSRGAGAILETTDHGYVLHVPPENVDAQRFAVTVRAADRVLAPLASQLDTGPAPTWPDRGEVTAAVERIESALDWWDGEPYADLPGHPDVLAERAALEQLRAGAEESRLLGLLALGEHVGVLATTEVAVSRGSLREQTWALHALALLRSGRQADALDSIRQLRDLLAEELGLDPGPQLRALEQAILQQSPALQQWLPAARQAAAPTSGAPTGHLDLSGLVGRDHERERLAGLLDRTRQGHFTAAQVVGEPGIGKTRLVDDLVERARSLGMSVALGRCSQDDGAPPLWPWRAVLQAIDAGGAETAPTPDETGPGLAAFATWDRIAGQVLAAASSAPLLVVLDDIHWADDATLRTLAHLLTSCPPDAAVCVVVTRRTNPGPTPATSLVAEALARRHAERLELVGLDAPASRALIAGLVPGPVEEAVAATWHERAGGNPFFLVELARLGATASGQVPATVRDVVLRRLTWLPERARLTLATAAAAGRRFRAETVAAASGEPLDDVLDDLELALGADLLLEADDESFAFTHALTRDAVYLAMPEHRRARLHAQVARAFEGDPEVRRLTAPEERTAELARHWLAAGSSHAERAWRAADAAADQARASSAYAEAMELRGSAVAAHRRSADGDDEQRYDLLLRLATDAAYAARWPQVEAAAQEATALGRALGSPARVGAAASTLSRYCVWLPHEPDADVEDIIDDLRWALEHAVEEDGVTRCRLQMALSVELYYEPDSSAERRALVDAGLRLARAADDPDLHWWACRTAWMASWVPEQVEERAAWAAEGVAAARRAGDAAAEAVLLVTEGLTLLELGHVDRWDELAGAAAAIARRDRLPFVLLTHHWMEMTLASLRGQTDLVREHHAGLVAVAPEVALPMQDMQGPAALTYSRLWSDSPAELAELAGPIAQAYREGRMAAVVAHVVLGRCGMVEELRAVLETNPLPSEEGSFWSSVADWCVEAETASVVGSLGLAVQAREMLTPYADRMAVAGAVMTVGPVAGYLALAEVVAGDRAAAARHADAALAAAERWSFAAYADWLTQHRVRLGF
ncbi:BTAD domain-containing putative transcriptional regulator [Nocardioides sp.]|uniref:BTAD domain-containing putative transcriptional regulator n=1 Tax=Nocardioides sp. TaxID=35761 RepID=UPI001A2D7435|nr:BTAD domain-containing putative transcriptional regulator [Nocardioides sp.]MBJ7355708.1 AAA family ATPase [Nocardioides sp.]